MKKYDRSSGTFGAALNGGRLGLLLSLALFLGAACSTTSSDGNSEEDASAPSSESSSAADDDVTDDNASDATDDSASEAADDNVSGTSSEETSSDVAADTSSSDVTDDSASSDSTGESVSDGDSSDATGESVSSEPGTEVTSDVSSDVTADSDTEVTGTNTSSDLDAGIDDPIPVPETAGAECLFCAVNGACEEQVAACTQQDDCNAWYGCVNQCETAACRQACDLANHRGAILAAAVNSCACGSCANECAPVAACDASCVNSLEPISEYPATLAETGLFVADNDGFRLADQVRPFAPTYELWADGAEKDRLIYLPECETIDSSDMDHWDFPVGTRLWKTFSLNGVNIETRLIHRFGPNPADWFFIAYQWDVTAPNDPTLALPQPLGVASANNTDHDIPTVDDCLNCHTKLSERVLGFSALQLTNQAGDTLRMLNAEGRFTVPPEGLAVPGDEVSQPALGYLHANCGHCHNDAFMIAPPAPKLRLLVENGTVEGTDTFMTLVNVPTRNVNFSSYNRIEPGEPELSEIILRMSIRNGTQMPPRATKQVDDDGVAIVSEWIASLSNDCAQGQVRGCSEGGALFGSCAAGTQTCSNDGSWGPCSILPEVNDGCVAGSDDSCNGVPNEGCVCIEDAVRSCADEGQLGLCAAGTELCSGGAWSACSVSAVPEVCDVDGLDENCDGFSNEGCP